LHILLSLSSMPLSVHSLDSSIAGTSVSFWSTYNVSSYAYDSGVPSTIVSDMEGFLKPIITFLRQNNSVVYCQYYPDGDTYSIMTKLTDGSTTYFYMYGQQVQAIEYDENTLQLFVVGVDWHNVLNLLQLNVDSGQVDGLLTLTGLGVIKEGISTYCPVGHILFLVNQDSQLRYSIARIDTQQKQILSNVMYSIDISDIMWDYSSETLYAWTSLGTNFTQNLVTLDTQSGKVLRTISTVQPYASHGGSAFDIKNKMVYTSMLNEQSFPSWISVNVNTGETKVVVEGDGSGGFPLSLVCTS